MSNKAKGAVEITVVRGRGAAAASATVEKDDDEDDEDDEDDGSYDDGEDDDDDEDDEDDDYLYDPFGHSWVIELEKAQEDLQDLQRRIPTGGGGGGASASRGDALIMAYRRLCRAHNMLNQWEQLEDAAQNGLDVCASYSARARQVTDRGSRSGGSRSGPSPTRIEDWEKCFRRYTNISRREMSVEDRPTRLYFPRVREILDALSAGRACPNRVVLRPHGLFSNSNLLQEAALVDLRHMEEIVARGAAIDFPFMSEQPDEATYRPPVVAPSDATALVAVCCNLVLAFSDHHPALEFGRARWSNVWWHGELQISVMCAMQLVHLGADPTRTLNVSKSKDALFSTVARLAGLDGMSALGLARLLKRTHRIDRTEIGGLTNLIELMERHVRYSTVERVKEVHCRCGSRLPWWACHGRTGGGCTVGGEPPPLFFCVLPELGDEVAYRVSPRAKCPCHETSLTYYECCWNDPTKPPMYLIDTTAQIITVERIAPNWPTGRVVEYLQETGTLDGPHDEEPFRLSVDASAASLLWWPAPSRFRELFAGEGPKSQWKTWDPVVYAGCVRRLRSHLFLWKDLHSNLDESELLERTAMWNEALERYCYDLELVGEERRRVIAKHRANPCAPCGRVGCDAFEKEVREFPRCSRCKSIAYCGRACQKLDWAEHRKVCGSVPRTEPS